jgi:hypothetical protein
VAERQAVLGYYRASQVFARVSAPFLTFAMLGLIALQTPVERLFNFYTLPMWLAAAMGLCCLVLMLCAFHNPPGEAASPLPGQGSLRQFRLGNAPNLWAHVRGLLAADFVVTCVMFLVYSQVFAFATAEYRLIKYAYNVWISYMGMLGGVLTGIAYWVYGKRRFRDAEFLVQACVVLALSFVLLVEFVTPPNAGLFFVGTFGLAFSFVLFFPSMESLYTTQVTQWEPEAQGCTGFVVSLLPAVEALGRFIGPVVGGLVLVLNQSPMSDLFVAYAESSGGATIDIPRALGSYSYIHGVCCCVVLCCVVLICLLRTGVQQHFRDGARPSLCLDVPAAVLLQRYGVVLL